MKFIEVLLCLTFLVASTESLMAQDKELPIRKSTEQLRPSTANPIDSRKAPPPQGNPSNQLSDPDKISPSDSPQEQVNSDPTESIGADRDPTANEPDGDIIDFSPETTTASRGLRRDLDISQSTSRVDALALERRVTTTVPDALSDQVGVLMQKTNQGGGSPVIRGRTGKDVLLLIDGQRFNNSTFRRNNQYLNTIDLGAVDSVEIVRGPASVLYGSDAMGGAINILTRRFDPAQEDDFSSRLSVQHSTYNNGWVSHASVAGKVGGFGLIGGVTFRDYDDLRAGRFTNPSGAVDIDGLQSPTGYRERDMSFALTRPLSDTDTLEARVLYSRQYDVPRSDRLIPNSQLPIAPDLRRDFDPQRLRWYTVGIHHSNKQATLESFGITASLNNPEEGRQRIRTSRPDELILERESVFIPGLSAHATIRWDADHLATTGFDATYEVIDSKRETVDLTTNTRTREDFGRYPDNSRYRSFGVFVQDEWKVSDDWIWTSGARYSTFQVSLDLEGLAIDELDPFENLDETYNDFTFSSGLTHALSQRTSLYGSISRGFRAPNLDDLAVVGDFASGERVPNLDLDPETVWNFEVGAKHAGQDSSAGGAAAFAFYQDLFDTEFLFVNESNESVFQIANVSRAIITTFECWGEHILDQGEDSDLKKTVFGQLTWTLGRNTTGDEPVQKIPPPEAMVGYRLEQVDPGGLSVEAFLRGALRQDHLSASDKNDPRIPNHGTPGWWTFNIRGGLDLAQDLRLTMGLENIFDRRYRVHGSGIDSPGFGMVLGLEWHF